MSIPTPQIAHLTEEDYRYIYEPAEDSFILLDALEIEADEIRASSPTLSIEIGSGSGIASAFVPILLANTTAAHFATDINPLACVATVRTAQANKVSIDVVRSNLLDPFLNRVQGLVDLVVFNPPYVPTENAELQTTQREQGIGGSWAGGVAGMQVTDQVLELIPTLLSPKGRFYLVAIEQNKPHDIIQRLSDRLHGSIVLKRRAGRELLSVIRFCKL